MKAVLYFLAMTLMTVSASAAGETFNSYSSFSQGRFERIEGVNPDPDSCLYAGVASNPRQCVSDSPLVEAKLAKGTYSKTDFSNHRFIRESIWICFKCAKK